jgi:hypothetical protein
MPRVLPVADICWRLSIVDGVTPDTRAQSPVDEIASHLLKLKDPTLLRKYGLWLVKRDPEQGLRVSDLGRI